MGEVYNFYNLIYSYSGNTLVYIILPIEILLCLKFHLTKKPTTKPFGIAI